MTDIIEMREMTLNHKRIAYTNKTEFLVQSGKYNHVYKTVYSFVGDLEQAIFHFNCIHIIYGEKKRLLAPSLNKPVLARVYSK